MVEYSTLIIAIVVTAIAGIVIGSVAHKRFGTSGTRARNLEQQLEDSKQQAAKYQQHVADHFSDTAALLNDLTLKYRDIHQHLAQGADTLCKDSDGKSLLSGVPIELDIHRKTPLEEQGDEKLRPPLDYAPKNQASQTGVLSEEFGLEKVSGVTTNNETTTGTGTGQTATTETSQ